MGHTQWHSGKIMWPSDSAEALIYATYSDVHPATKYICREDPHCLVMYFCSSGVHLGDGVLLGKGIQEEM